MSICETTDKQVPGTTMTLERRVYEDGYYQVSLLNSEGVEIDSRDGTATTGQMDARIGLAEDILLSDYYDA